MAGLIHGFEVLPQRSGVKAWTRDARGTFLVLAALLGLVLTACDDDPTGLVDPRFGQVGELLVEVRSPVFGGTGVLEESLLWTSRGPWVLAERISYGGVQGAETIRRPTLNPGELVQEYASLIRQLNETQGLRLFVDAVPQDLNPTCAGTRSQLAVTIRDTFRDEQARWVRCVDGTLFTASPASAGPDAGASRIATAAQLARSFTLGDNLVSTYLGTVPFSTLDQGPTSTARPSGPIVFRSSDGAVPPGWSSFAELHFGEAATDFEVDWENEMVLLGAIGRRLEAGGSVRVQRVLPIDQGTRIELVERVPGDFCSPAAQENWPFHLVVAPRTAPPVIFNQPVVERVPCGA